MKPTNGQTLLLRIEEWIAGWIAFPDVPQGQALIAALWALHTWFAPKWPLTAYAHITGDGPGVGKTVLLEVLASLSANPKPRVTLRPLEMVRAIQTATETHGFPLVTFFCDEMEKLSHMGASDARSILTSGYKMGGTHGVTVGTKSIEYPTYCPKAFASIGTLDDVFRSRSVMFRLTAGKPRRSWSDAVLSRGAEARGLVDAFKAILTHTPDWMPVEELTGREREIWTPINSTALALGLDAPTMARVRAAMFDLIEYKITTESKTYRELRVEPKDQEREYAARVLADLSTVMGAADHIFSAVAVEKLRALPSGPWRVFRGAGIDPISLSALLARFDVKPVQIKRKGVNQRGFRAADVQRALAAIGGAK